MRERLEALLSVCRAYDADSRDRKYELPVASDIRAQVPTARKIVEAIDPDLVGEHFGFDELYAGFHETRRTLEMALGLLADKDELAAMLAPDAPSIVADQLHSIIWQSAAPLWDTGEYKTAVQQAAVNLSAHIKARVGSHLNERELVQQVFSPDLPKPGQTRLHLPGNRDDKNWKSAQDGLHLIAQGAFAGIRNIAVHGPDQWTEHEGLEHLAVLSVVARWTDLTTESTVQSP